MNDLCPCGLLHPRVRQTPECPDLGATWGRAREFPPLAVPDTEFQQVVDALLPSNGKVVLYTVQGTFPGATIRSFQWVGNCEIVRDLILPEWGICIPLSSGRVRLAVRRSAHVAPWVVGVGLSTGSPYSEWVSGGSTTLLASPADLVLDPVPFARRVQVQLENPGAGILASPLKGYLGLQPAAGAVNGPSIVCRADRYILRDGGGAALSQVSWQWEVLL